MCYSDVVKVWHVIALMGALWYFVPSPAGRYLAVGALILISVMGL